MKIYNYFYGQTGENKVKIVVINGPNLNMLGIREPKKYGKKSLENINENLKKLAETLNCDIEFFQSNNEGDLVTKIQSLRNTADGILINAGAYTHTSIAVRDALLAIETPFIEVHMSNIYTREDFRHKSYLSDIALAVVSGFGEISYEVGLIGIVKYLSKN